MLLGGLIVALGRFSLFERVGSALVVAVAVGYLVHRDRRGFRREFVRGNLLYLLPGHLALLLGLSVLVAGYRPYLWWAWLVLVLGTLAFDAVAHSGWSFAAQKRAVMVLYALVWADAFFLIQRLIALGGKLDGAGLQTLSAALAVFGVAYIGLALYRFNKLQATHE